MRIIEAYIVVQVSPRKFVVCVGGAAGAFQTTEHSFTTENAAWGWIHTRTEIISKDGVEMTRNAIPMRARL